MATRTSAPTPTGLTRAVPRAWVALLRAHATLTREMDANLQAEHQLTINDYEVLLALARAPERKMRRVDLAGQVLLTQSGITRLLQGLERAGLVERADCPRTTFTARRGTPARSAISRQSASFALPSTGGAVTRTSTAPARSPAISLRRLRG